MHACWSRRPCIEFVSHSYLMTKTTSAGGKSSPASARPARQKRQSLNSRKHEYLMKKASGLPLTEVEELFLDTILSRSEIKLRAPPRRAPPRPLTLPNLSPVQLTQPSGSVSMMAAMAAMAAVTRPNVQFPFLATQQQALVKIKTESAEQATKTSDLKDEINKEKEASAAHDDQHAILQIKKEQATEISNTKEKIEEEKKKSATHQLNLDRMRECVVCQDEDRCVAVFPCSHLALCATCQNLVEICPICREKIEERRTIRVP